MPVTADKVIVELEARVGRYNASVRDAGQRFERSMRDTTRAAQTAEARVTRSFAGIGRAAGTVAGTIIGALGTRAVTQYADAWTSAGNKIKAASLVSGVGAESLADLSRNAAAARSDFEGYVDLYARLLRTGGQLGATQQDVALATDIAAKAFKAGGAAASEQAAGILQLGQALGSGVLQGDELRSLRENAPLLTQAIADEFGVTIGQLKKLGEEGKLTSDRVFRAILNGQQKIEAQFAVTQSTIGDGFQNLRTALIRYVGDADDAIGATEGLVAALNALARNLDLVVAAATILGVRAVAPLVAALATRLAPAALTAATALQLLAVRGGASIVAMGALRGALAILGGPLGALLVAATAGGFALERMGLFGASASEAIGDLGNSITSLRGVMGELESDTNALERANDQLTTAIEGQQDAAAATARIEIDAINRRIAKNRELKGEYESLIRAQISLAQSALIAERQQFQSEFGAPTGEQIAATFGTGGAGLGTGGLREVSQEQLNSRLAEVALDNISRLQSEINRKQAEGLTLSAEENSFLEKTIALKQNELDLAGKQQALEELGKPITVAPVTGGGVTPAAGGGKAAKTSAEPISELEREISAIQRRTREIEAMTAVQAGINPLIDDFGFAIAKAAAEQDLLNAALEDGAEVTPELAALIDLLAGAYAAAEVDANKLADAQDDIRDKAADFEATAKNVLGGFISDLKSGKTATDALANALEKVSDKLLDIALNSLDFSGLTKGSAPGAGLSAGGPGGGLLSTAASFIASLLPFDTGGYTGGRRGKPAGIVHGEEFVVRAGQAAKFLPLLEAINSGRAPGFANGGAVPDLSVPSLRTPAPAFAGGSTQMINLGGLHVSGVRNVDEFRQAEPQIFSDLNRRLSGINRRGIG